MATNPKDSFKGAFDAARDIAAHAVEKASDIVENAGEIIRGDIAGGTSGIVQNSMDIATHAIDRTKEAVADGLGRTKDAASHAAESAKKAAEHVKDDLHKH